MLDNDQSALRREALDAGNGKRAEPIPRQIRLGSVWRIRTALPPYVLHRKAPLRRLGCLTRVLLHASAISNNRGLRRNVVQRRAYLGLAPPAGEVAESLKDGARADVVLVLPTTVVQPGALEGAQHLAFVKVGQLVNDLVVRHLQRSGHSRRVGHSPQPGWASTSKVPSCSWVSQGSLKCLHYL